MTGDVITNVLTLLLNNGVTGAFAGVFLLLYIRKDRELADERKARISDNKEGFNTLISVQEKTHTVIEKMTDMFEESRKLFERIRGGKGE